MLGKIKYEIQGNPNNCPCLIIAYIPDNILFFLNILLIVYCIGIITSV